MNQISSMELVYCTRLLLAAISGMILGWERYNHSKLIGIRVYCLASFASALMTVLSICIVECCGSGDPSRIAANVVTGVSFICLAVISRQGNTLRGLTTAVGLWVGSAIGICFGGGFLFLGIFATVFTALVQAVMHRLHFDNDSMAQRDVTIRMKNDLKFKETIVKEIESLGAEVSSRSIRTNPDGTITYIFVIRPSRQIHFEDVAALMEKYPGEVFDVSMA